MGRDAFDVSSQENRPRDDGEKLCTAMAQQHSADGTNENIATPQKLLHLVGYRDANLKGLATYAGFKKI
jgi:hypothetical protein